MDMHVAALTAAEAHRAAIARHAETVEEAAAARGEVERLVGARAAMLADPRATAAKLKACDTAVSDTQRRAELAEAREGAARRAAEHAEIEALHEQAVDFEHRKSEATERVARAGAAFKKAIEEARTALVHICNAGFDQSLVANGVALFAEDVKATATTNATLAALEPNQWPRLKPGARLDPVWHSLRIELLERGGEDPIELHRLLAGLPRQPDRVA